MIAQFPYSYQVKCETCGGDKARRPGCEAITIMPAFALIGPTDIGKTYGLRHLLPNNILIRHMDDVRHIKPHHQHVIFDDISYKFINTPETVIHLLDSDEATSLRILRGVVHIPPHVTKWFTHNDRDFIYPILSSDRQREAIDRRITIYEVNSRDDVRTAIIRSIRS